MNKSVTFIIPLLALLLFSFSCKKKKADPHVPPDVVFKSGAGYIDGDRTVNKKDTVMVGIVATKTEDDLKSYNVSFYYDGAATSTTFYNYVLSSAEAESYSHDIKIGARNQAGSEKWVFSIVDRDGNITQKTIVLTVN
jgi:hypothetical protein